MLFLKGDSECYYGFQPSLMQPDQHIKMPFLGILFVL